MSSQANPNKNRCRCDTNRQKEQGIPSQHVIDETNRLYVYHLTSQMTSVGLKSPLENKVDLTIPHNAYSFQTLAKRFASSPQRRWVHEQAQNVDLESLNCITFQELMYGLFQNGGVTCERVLVLFYFCTDISIRALQEKLVDHFLRIYNWTTCYFSKKLSAWVEEQGGWSIVLETSVDFVRSLSIICACCFSILVLYLFIRSK